jgi:hypothetical protein
MAMMPLWPLTSRAWVLNIAGNRISESTGIRNRSQTMRGSFALKAKTRRDFRLPVKLLSPFAAIIDELR